MSVRKFSQRGLQTLEVSVEKWVRLLQEQDERRVGNILARRAPVDEAG